MFRRIENICNKKISKTLLIREALEGYYFYPDDSAIITDTTNIENSTVKSNKNLIVLSLSITAGILVLAIIIICDIEYFIDNFINSIQ